jgi:hypothetical protein
VYEQGTTEQRSGGEPADYIHPANIIRLDIGLDRAPLKKIEVTRMDIRDYCSYLTNAHDKDREAWKAMFGKKLYLNELTVRLSLPDAERDIAGAAMYQRGAQKLLILSREHLYTILTPLAYREADVVLVG